MKSDSVRLANDLRRLPASSLFNDWNRVVRELVNMGFNRFEIEAILSVRLENHGRTIPEIAQSSMANPKSSTTVAKFIKTWGITHHSKMANELVMKAFGEKYGLKFNDEGIPCTEGTMPGNPEAGKVLVPLGTPACCDPTQELYWSM